MLILREKLIEAEERRLAGEKGFTVSEVAEEMRRAIKPLTVGRIINGC